MDREKEYTEIDVVQIFKALWHRAWVILLAMLVAGGLLFSYASFCIRPLYQAGAMMYVNNSSISVGNTSVNISSGDISAAKSLVNTYVVILNSRKVLEDVIKEAGVSYSYEQLQKMISAAPVNSTEVFEVLVTGPDPEEAEKIANCICRVLPDKIADVVEGSSVRIVDYAVVPVSKCSPNVTSYTAIGMLIGVLASCLVIVLRELFDQYIRSEDYLMQTFDIPVLAVIPDLAQNDPKGSYYYKRQKED